MAYLQPKGAAAAELPQVAASNHTTNTEVAKLGDKPAYCVSQSNKTGDANLQSALELPAANLPSYLV